MQPLRKRSSWAGPLTVHADRLSPSPVPPPPLQMIDSYDPVRTCRKETEVSACNRGWGVYESMEICCAPNVAFPEGEVMRCCLVDE